MPAPNYKRQKRGWTTLDQLYADAPNVWVIHYSCESFYERPEGRSARITSIAVRKLDSGQTVSFSIHQVAERQRVATDQIAARYDELEKQMLDEFYEHVRTHQGIKYVHWNMRDINYGFAAIEHRHRVLAGTPFVVGDDKKFDLARILIDIFGVGYIGHPRLEMLLEKNHMRPPDFMTGKEEADAFDAGNYVGLHQSTLRKVDVIANLIGRAHDRALKTNTTWWEMHGGLLRGPVNFIASNRLFQVAAGAASILGFILWFWS